MTARFQSLNAVLWSSQLQTPLFDLAHRIRRLQYPRASSNLLVYPLREDEEEGVYRGRDGILTLGDKILHVWR